MALVATHDYVNPIADNPMQAAEGRVTPARWNAPHPITGEASDDQLPNTITAAGPIGSATTIPVITYDAKGRLTAVTTATAAVPAAGNPTASVGLTADNGSASTFMRSDGAPALNPAEPFAFSGLGATVISQQGVSSSALTLTGGTVTTSQPLISGTQTWSNSGVGFKGIFFNFTKTAGASSSVLYDFQVNGTTASKLAFDGTLAATFFQAVSGGTNKSYLDGRNDASWIFSNNNSTQQVILSFPSSATWQFGAANAASPVAQTLKVQDATGTDTAAAASWTLKGPMATGAGNAGGIVFQTGVKHSSGTTPSTATTALTLAGETQTATFGGDIIAGGVTKLKSYTVGTVPSASGKGAGSMIYVSDESGGAVPAFSDGTNWRRDTDRAVIS